MVTYDDIVCRLLLLLQTCIYEFESISGRTPSSLPLSLSTSIKRFSRGFVQQSFKYKELNKKVKLLIYVNKPLLFT